MAISSNTLFHYTSKLNSLKSILKSGFKVSYCRELDGVFPMISFCDLPLGQAKLPLNDYGEFAIGMNNEWAKKNKLNPVLYLESESYLTEEISKALLSVQSNAHSWMSKTETSIIAAKAVMGNNHPEIVNRFIDLTQSVSSLENSRTMVKSMLNIFRFSKPFKGDLIRDGQIVSKNHKFYDEREWRYIPDYDYKGIIPQMSFEQYEKFKENHPTKPHIKHKKHAVSFKASDINYLIVKQDSDIPKLITHLNNQDHLGSAREIRLLTTKIMTAKQIKEDL